MKTENTPSHCSKPATPLGHGGLVQLCCNVLLYTELYCTRLHCFTLHCSYTVLFSTTWQIPYCIVLCCIVLYCTTLQYCIVLWPMHLTVFYLGNFNRYLSIWMNHSGDTKLILGNFSWNLEPYSLNWELKVTTFYAYNFVGILCLKQITPLLLKFWSLEFWGLLYIQIYRIKF